jgi:hypothetical protein
LLRIEKKTCWTLGWLVLLSGVTLRAQEAKDVTEEVAVHIDQVWQKFPTFVLFRGGPPAVTKTLELLRNRGWSGCEVPASESSAPSSLARVNFYVEDLAGTGDLRLDAETFAADRQMFLDERDSRLPVRPISLSDPAVLERMKEQVAKGVARHRVNRPVAYSLGDGISLTAGISPLDYCYEEHTLVAMRSWLQRRYTSLATLNEAWGTEFESLEQVVPLTTDASRTRNEGLPLKEINFSSWNDHREFMNVVFADVVGELTRVVREMDPGVPVGFLGGQANAAYGGFDWWRLAKICSFLEAEEFGLTPEMIHAFARRGTRVVSTLELDERRPDDQLGVDLWHRVARGDHGIIVSSSLYLCEEERLEVSRAGKDLNRSVGVARKISKNLQTKKTKVAPRVLIYVSVPSVRAAWMVDSWTEGDDWVERVTDFEKDHSLTTRTREGWGSLFREISLPFGFLDSRDLVAGGGAELEADVVILNETLALSDSEVHELLRFVASGGLLIADAHAAMFDQRLRGRDSRALAALFGLERPTTVSLDELGTWVAGRVRGRASARSFGMRRGEGDLVPVPGVAVSLDLGYMRRIADGAAVYMNIDMRDYNMIAETQGQYAETLRLRLADLLTRETPLRLNPHLPYDTTCRRYHLWVYGERHSGYLFLAPNEVGAVEQRLEVPFGDVVELQDVLQNVALGSRRRVSLRVGPDQPHLLRLKPSKVERPGLAGGNQERQRKQ